QPEAECKRCRGRRRGINDVVEVRQPPVVLSIEETNERLRRGDRGAKSRLPQRDGAFATGRHDAPLVNPQVVAECRKRPRRALIQKLQQLWMLREVLERLIVEPGKTAADERGTAIGKDGYQELIRRHGVAKNRAAPDSSGQGNWYDDGLCAGAHVDARPD